MARISSISIDVSPVDAAENACVQVLYDGGALYLHGATYDVIRAWLRDVAAEVDASEARQIAKSAPSAELEYAHAE